MAIYTPNPANNPTSITIPVDGQGPIKAADVNPAFEGLADQIAHLKARASMVDVYTFAYGNDAAVAPLWTRTNASYGDSTISLSITGLLAGDILDIDSSVYLVTDAATGDNARFRMKISDSVPNITNPVGCTALLTGNTGLGGCFGQFSFATHFVVVNPGTHQVLFEGKSLSGSASIAVWFSAMIKAKLFRAGTS